MYFLTLVKTNHKLNICVCVCFSVCVCVLPNMCQALHKAVHLYHLIYSSPNPMRETQYWSHKETETQRG